VYYRDLLCPQQITISSTLLQHLSETVPMRGELCFLHSLGLEVVLLPCVYSCMPLAVVRLRCMAA
jgi:hypothetical protein